MDNTSLRRKFLRGSLAAPVVLTIASASTAAAASFTRCLKSTDWTKTAFFTPDPDNLWFRRQVTAQLLAYNGVNQGWYFLDQVTNLYVSTTAPYTSQTFGSLLPTGWTVSEPGTRWALVWFDKRWGTEYSKITLQQPFQSYPATMSCYGSFNVG